MFVGDILTELRWVGLESYCGRDNFADSPLLLQIPKVTITELSRRTHRAIPIMEQMITLHRA
jgi:hypothetical protein